MNANMTRTRTFLTADWRNLVMLNYAVDPALLAPLVPSGTELDFYDGKTWLSLIGFEFNRTRVLGFRIPFHQSFEEVNVRFYVRRGSRRGVVFIRELVPKRAVAAIARWAFNEKYQRVPMSHRMENRADGEVGRAEYAWRSGSEQCAMKMETEGTSFLPDEGSKSQFITEHYWGYAARKGRRLPGIRGAASPMDRMERATRQVLRRRRCALWGPDRTNPGARTGFCFPRPRFGRDRLQRDENYLVTAPSGWD